MKNSILPDKIPFPLTSLAIDSWPVFCYKLFIPFWLAFAPLLSWGQIEPPRFAFQYDSSVKVLIDEKNLLNAWAGGFNAGQFSTIDLNGDLVNDLVVFDRTNNKLSTFLTVTTNGGFIYQYAPEYEFAFPDLNGWVLLADYNHDGKKDIFTHTNLGVLVYKNTSVQGQLHWEISADPIYTEGLSGQVNLQISISDMPSIVDVDDDGDLDILTFNFAGGYVEYHQNQSWQKYGNSDSLIFKRIGFCWGNFESAGCGNFNFDIDCGGGGRKASPGEGLRVAHLGSTLLALDLNGDQRKEILVGDVDCNFISCLNNQGTLQKANFTSFQKDYPDSKPIRFPIFPAVFYEDVDFDGKKDLIASPNLSDNEGNQVNFQQSTWFYHNAGKEAIPEFEFRQPDFLQNEMIELGENASPALADYDGDGDLDLFVGNAGLLTTNDELVAGISLFENVGTVTKPSFALQNRDYLNLSTFKISNLRPFFADINRDGSPDFCFTSNKAQVTQMHYLSNAAARRQAFRFTLSDTNRISLPLGLNDSPFPYDMDGDGDLDWLVGQTQGSLAYYQTSGSVTQPLFTLKNESVGGITPNASRRGIVPVVTDLNNDNHPELLIGDRNGHFTLYENILGNLDAGKTFVPLTNLVLDSLGEEYTSAKLGSTIFPTAADLTNDYLSELIIGTNAGGLIYLKNHGQPTGNKPIEETAWVYPNPSTRYLYVQLPYPADWNLFTLLGQQVSFQKGVPANKEEILDLGFLANGMYILRITAQNGEVRTHRIVVAKK